MITILQYHEISESLVFNPNICPKKMFSKHLDFLHGFRIRDITPDLRHGNLSFQSNGCLITFDDGYKGVLNNAFPLMEKFGYKGLVFLVSGYLNSSSRWDVPLLSPLPHLSKSDVRYLFENGWLIGSHSHSHRDLTRLSYKQIKEDITTSKKVIEDIIGAEIRYFSYPFGKLNQQVKDVLKELGFRFAFKSASLLRRFDDLLEISRHSVYIIDFAIKWKFDSFYNGFENIKEVLANKFAYISPLFQKASNSGNCEPGYK